MAVTDLYDFRVEIWRESRKVYYLVEQTVKGKTEFLGRGQTESWPAAAQEVKTLILDNLVSEG